MNQPKKKTLKDFLVIWSLPISGVLIGVFAILTKQPHGMIVVGVVLWACLAAAMISWFYYRRRNSRSSRRLKRGDHNVVRWVR